MSGHRPPDEREALFRRRLRALSGAPLMTDAQELAAAATVLCIAGAGWYVGNQNDRFLTCDDFERSGDFQPDNCLR